MRQRTNNRTAGFSLLEVVVGIALLGLVTVPICASLVLSVRLNAHSQSLMHAQLQASGMVETLLASGVDASEENGWTKETHDGQEVWVKDEAEANIEILAKEKGIYYEVSVTAEAGKEGTKETVTLHTSVRKDGGA